MRSSWVRRPLTCTVAYSCPQFGIWSWTHPDQPMGCPEWAPVGLCPSSIILLTVSIIIIIILFFIIILHSLLLIGMCHLSPHQDIPTLVTSQGCCIYLAQSLTVLQHCNCRRPSGSKRLTFQPVSTAAWLLNNCPVIQQWCNIVHIALLWHYVT